MPPFGLEPETLTYAAQTITQLTKCARVKNAPSFTPSNQDSGAGGEKIAHFPIAQKNGNNGKRGNGQMGPMENGKMGRWGKIEKM